jgi:hypothetical protein
MMNMYAQGSDPNYYYTKAAVSVSADAGHTWQLLPVPAFVTPEGVQQLVPADDHWLCLSDAGGACVTDSLDMNTWGTPYKFKRVSVQPQHTVWISDDSHHVMVGWKKDAITLGEHAVCMKTARGVDDASWRLTFQHSDDHSAFTHMCVDTTHGDLFAVGRKQGDQALFMWSGDSGETWQEIPVPAAWNEPLYHVSGTRNSLKIGSQGRILLVQWDGVQATFSTSQLLLSDQGRRKSVTWVQDQAQSSGVIHTLACQQDQIWFSTNGVDYQKVTTPGYTMVTGVPVADDWLVAGHSLLNSATGFRVTTQVTPDPQISLTPVHTLTHVKNLLKL